MYQSPPPAPKESVKPVAGKRPGSESPAKWRHTLSDIHPLVQMGLLIVCVVACFAVAYGVLLLPNLLGWQ